MPLVAQLTEPNPSDSRSAVRRTLRLHTPAHSPRGATAALIHDLSERGLRLEVEARILVDEIISVELPEAGIVEAQIVWVSDRLVGCRFLQPVPRAAVSAALLRSPASDVSVKPRELPELPMIGVVEQPPVEGVFTEIEDWSIRTPSSLTFAALAIALVVATLFILILLVQALQA